MSNNFHQSKDSSDIVMDFFYKIVEKQASQEKKVESFLQSMTEEEKKYLARRIQYFFLQGENIDSLADAYLALCDYLAEERIYFVKTGTYRYHSFEETASLYEDSNYMFNAMLGLGVSAYMWQIQKDNMRFFRDACKKDTHTSGRYLEIGPGHGEYFVTAMENTNFDEYIGVDISETSVEMTKGFAKYAVGNKKKYSVLHKNFFDYDSNEKFQGIVMGEVLEHVENPLDFLKKISELADEDSFIYLSTAINAPYPDHIYLFRNMEEIYELFDQADLRVKDEICTTSEGITLEKAIKKKFDIIVGFILEKK